MKYISEDWYYEFVFCVGVSECRYRRWLICTHRNSLLVCQSVGTGGALICTHRNSLLVCQSVGTGGALICTHRNSLLVCQSVGTGGALICTDRNNLCCLPDFGYNNLKLAVSTVPSQGI